MFYQEEPSISNLSVTESEHFTIKPANTPRHHYNTRFSARLFRNSSKALDFRESSQDQNEDTYRIENFEHSSDRFSVASPNCLGDSLESFTEPVKKESCAEWHKKYFAKPMDFIEPPCVNDRKKWIKNGGIVLVAAILGWYVNHVRLQFTKIRADVDSANERISDIVDARLDTMYKLSDVSKMVKELRQSQGGRIVRLSPGTENYGQPKSSLLGISLCEGMHGPRAMIQIGTSPGECWAFKGSSGGVIIKLLGLTKIDAVSMEHISKNISPSGDSTTAPKDFTVWGLKTPTDRGTLLGQFSYQMSGSLVQMFPLPTPVYEPFELIELKILSNHGNPDFTCIYRFRVHGTMEKQ